MKTIQVYDPPMCCSTGLCGTEIDPALVSFAALLTQLRQKPEAVLRLLERLRDPAFTRILLVTLPEATPVHEAAALQEDLRRAHMEPFAWVINQSLLHSGSCDPLLQCREESEHRYLREVVEKQSTRTAWLPWQAQEPIGPDALAQLAAATLHTATL